MGTTWTLEITEKLHHKKFVATSLIRGNQDNWVSLILIYCGMATTGQQMRIKGKDGPTPELLKDEELLYLLL